MTKHSDPVGTELIRPATRLKTNKATKRRKVAGPLKVARVALSLRTRRAESNLLRVAERSHLLLDFARYFLGGPRGID